jgi:hypothetical protein
MRLFYNIIFCSFLITFFLYSEVQSQSIQSEIKNLSKGADIILTGKVVKQNSSWNQDGSRIYTAVEIQAEEYLKGDYNQKTIVLTTLGGEVGNIGELYSHMPKFSNDEEVLLFVKNDKKDLSYKVLNGEQGKLTLQVDKNGGEKITGFNMKISELKKEIKGYVETQTQE